MRAALCFVLASAAVLLPTVIRNYRVIGHFVPVRVGSGESLLEALGPWADGGPGMDRIVWPADDGQADEYERDRNCRQAAIAWAASHPRETLDLAFAKFARTWSVTMNFSPYTSLLYGLICWLTVAPVYFLAAAGLWSIRRQPALVALLLAPAVYFTLIHMVFVGSVRYRLPAMPLLFVAAALAISAGWRGRVRSR